MAGMVELEARTEERQLTGRFQAAEAAGPKTEVQALAQMDNAV